MPDKDDLKTNPNEKPDEQDNQVNEPDELDEPEKSTFSFESEEDFMQKTGSVMESVLEKRRVAREQSRARKQSEKQLEQESKSSDKIFPTNYQAKDWEEAGSHLLNAWDKKQTAKEAKATLEIGKINKRYDDELADIRTKNPDLPAKGTGEGIAFEKSLAAAAVKYGSTTMTGAFAAWKDTGGGKGKGVSKKQSDLARKVGSGSGTDKVEQSVRKYRDVTNSTLDDAEERAAKRLEKMS